MIITKTTVECYKIRIPGNCVWADISIDDLGDGRGRVSISSDYGNWAYFWSGSGPSFKRFLRTLNMDYVADKFGEDEWPDTEKTIKNFRKDVIESRRFGSRTTKKQAREIWDEINTLEEQWGSDSMYVVFKEWGLGAIEEFYDFMPEASYAVSPRFRRFWNELWLPFVEHIAAEESPAPMIPPTPAESQLVA